MSPEYKDIFEKHEFAKNCDAFVNEVNTSIKNRYQKIDVNALNETTFILSMPTEKIQEYKEMLKRTENPDQHLKSLQRIIRSDEIESAKYNFASATIWVWKDHDKPAVLEETIFALNDIILCSQKHSGLLLTELGELFYDSDKDDDENEPKMSLGDLETLGSLLRGLSGNFSEEEQPGISRYDKGRLMDAHLYFSFSKPKYTNKEIAEFVLNILEGKRKKKKSP